MSKDFNWKPYCVFVLVVSALISIYNWRIGLCIVLATLVFFINDKLNIHKFPSLQSKKGALLSLFLVVGIQGVLIVAIGLGSYYIGGLVSFFAAFAGLITPHLYFIVRNLIKK